MRKLLLLSLLCLALATVAHAQATNYCNDQVYQTFEGGTAGTVPTGTQLAASSKGRPMTGLWTPPANGTITYSNVDMQALVAPGRLCGDSTTYTNAVGTTGIVLTGDGTAASNFVSVRLDLQPVYPANMTDAYASVEYNEDYGASGDHIDCFVIHGTSDFSSVNCYGDTSPRRFLDLECTNTPISHGGDCGTGGGFVWTPSTQCPCKLVLHYGTGNGTTLSHHDLWAYDKNGALIGHIQHTSQLAADNPVYVKMGNQIGQGSVTLGKHSWWDNFQFSPNTVVPGQFCAGASPTWTTSPDNASMQTCLNSAVQTDTVNVLSGTATWNAVTVLNNNGASIAGATTISNAGLATASAIDNTTITTTGGSSVFLGNFTPTSGVTTVSGLTFNWLSGGSSNSGVVSFVGSGGGTCSGMTAATLPTFRFTGNHVIINTTSGLGTVFSWHQCNWGVIDHNFVNRLSGNTGMFGGSGDSKSLNRGYVQWRLPLALASQQAVYLETNTILDSGGQNTEGLYDCYSGDRYVLRFNYMQGHDGGCHGTDSDNSRSLISQETYGNTFVMTPSQTTNGLVNTRVRGGTSMFFENAFTTSGSPVGPWNGMILSEYRFSSCPANCASFGVPAVNLFVTSTDTTSLGSVTTSTTASGGQFCGPSVPGRDVLTAAGAAGNATCNAANAGDTASTFFDGPGTGGYPARDQVGRAPAGQILVPSYQWLNTGQGASAFVLDPVGPAATTYIQECREYYNYSASFTGGACVAGNGGGSGTALPATCSINEFFWKTNEGNWNSSGLTFPDGTTQGRLYQCKSANSWQLYYTPGVYPHPLVAGGASTATPILSPNNALTGNNADTVQPPTMAFGNQGTNTASMAVSGSISNCSNLNIPACSGTGNLTLASANALTITGTNPPNNTDFVVTPGGCTNGLVIASGGSCAFTVKFTPTAAANTAETATLTVNYANSTPSSSMTLTGTSATVTTLATSSCPTTLTNGVLYQLTANITCGGTAFIGQSVSLNLNGFTITWNNTAQTTQTGAIQINNFGGTVIAYNGTISQGAGANTVAFASFPYGIIGQTGNFNYGDGSQLFNLTFNYSFQYWAAIYTPGPGGSSAGGNSIIHDVVFNDTAVGTCAAVGCRSGLQSTVINQAGAVVNGGTHWYNNVINGSAQGGMAAQSPGAIVEHNIINTGNTTGKNSNDFALYCWGGCVAHDNLINLAANTNSRGVQMSVFGGGGSKSVFNNTIAALGLQTSLEYTQPPNTPPPVCETGGTYGIQYDDNTQTVNNVNANNVTAYANQCGASGLRLTDTEVATNTSTNSTYNAVRQTGAVDCNQPDWQDPFPGCAFGSSLSGPSGFVSTGDTFTADSGDICLCSAGATGTVQFVRPTFNKGSNPSTQWHTFWAVNGPQSPGVFFVIDATTGTGVSLTDQHNNAQNSNHGTASINIQWTQTVTVKSSTGTLVSGATVNYTDTLGHLVTCTTNASGVCADVVTQNRLNNDAGANQVENHNPFTRVVSATGFPTNTANNITITSPNAVTVTFSGATQAATPTFIPPGGAAGIPIGYFGPQSVSISTTSTGAIICYTTTTNGSTPIVPVINGGSVCTTGTLYSGPLLISIDTVISAVAGGINFSDSVPGIAAYAIQGARAPSMFSGVLYPSGVLQAGVF